MIIKRAAHGRHLLKTGALPEAKPVLAARRRPPGRRRAPSLPLLLRQPAAFFSQAVGFFIPPIAGVGLDFLEAEGKVFGDLLGKGLVILC